MTNDTDEEKEIERQILEAEAAGTGIGEIEDARRELDEADTRESDEARALLLILANLD